MFRLQIDKNWHLFTECETRFDQNELRRLSLSITIITGLTKQEPLLHPYYYYNLLNVICTFYAKITYNINVKQYKNFL